MKPQSELPSFVVDHKPWALDANPMWPLSVFSLRRNIGKYPFPAKLEEGQTQQLFEFMRNVLQSASFFQEPAILKSAEISPIDREYLFEHFFSWEAFQNLTPGEGFVFDKLCQLFGILNGKDHLHLQWIDTQGNLEKAYTDFMKVENELGNALDFAFLPKFGYLTSDLSNCGTGLTVSIYLHLPALIRKGQLMEALNQSKEERLPSAV